MRQLEPKDIESELSYAYLHAVCARAAMGCEVTSRVVDGNGVDARVSAWGPFPNGGPLTEVTINVQLKATKKSPADSGTHLSYFVQGVKRYDDLRAETVSIPRILVVLFLPAEMADWLSHTTEQLALRQCSYWVCLRSAGPASNPSGATVKIPNGQVFSPDALTDLATRLSRREVLRYEEP